MELAEMINNEGVIGTIVILFLSFVVIEYKNNTKRREEEIVYRRNHDSKINDILLTINKSLDINIKQQEIQMRMMNDLIGSYKIHDERSIEIKDALIEVKTICKDRRNKQ